MLLLLAVGFDVHCTLKSDTKSEKNRREGKYWQLVQVFEFFCFIFSLIFFREHHFAVLRKFTHFLKQNPPLIENCVRFIQFTYPGVAQPQLEEIRVNCTQRTGDEHTTQLLDWQKPAELSETIVYWEIPMIGVHHKFSCPNNYRRAQIESFELKTQNSQQKTHTMCVWRNIYI